MNREFSPFPIKNQLQHMYIGLVGVVCQTHASQIKWQLKNSLQFGANEQCIKLHYTIGNNFTLDFVARNIN